MKRYRGGSFVKQGGYWSFSNGRHVSISAEGGVLPGGGEVSYVRAALPVVVLLSPFLGLGYVLFLPFVGFGMAMYLLGRGLRVVVEEVGERLVGVAAPNWAPGRAYFARRRAVRESRKRGRR